MCYKWLWIHVHLLFTNAHLREWFKYNLQCKSRSCECMGPNPHHFKNILHITLPVWFLHISRNSYTFVKHYWCKAYQQEPILWCNISFGFTLGDSCWYPLLHNCRQCDRTWLMQSPYATGIYYTFLLATRNIRDACAKCGVLWFVESDSMRI